MPDDDGCDVAAKVVRGFVRHGGSMLFLARLWNAGILPARQAEWVVTQGFMSDVIVPRVKKNSGKGAAG
jgi:hypothetical protein